MKVSLILTLFIFLSLSVQSSFAKMFVRKEYTIDTESSYRYSDRWTFIRATEEESLSELVELLSRSATGKKVIALATKKAKTYGISLMEALRPGEGSLTDTTLIRKFSPGSPDEIVYESRSKVYINRSLSVKNAILDMAHELTHFSLRDPFNPYVSNFGLKDFVVSTVEGKGGEVEAYLVECQVSLELFPKQTSDSNCAKVVNEQTGRVDKELGIKKFYQLGRYYSVFQNSLKRHQLATTDFTYSGHDRADFISSAYGLPYPLAAIHEYESIMQRVCLNDQKRLAIMKSNLERSPASESNSEYESLLNGHRAKCSAFITAQTSDS